MITTAKGLQIGLTILELLRSHDKLSRYEIDVGTFTNCREVGLTFHCSMAYQDGELKDFGGFTWCVYEHRNSDEIIINGKKGHISLNGDLPYKADSKYEYLGKFSWGQYDECAEALATLIIEYADKQMAKKTPKTQVTHE